MEHEVNPPSAWGEEARREPGDDGERQERAGVSWQLWVILVASLCMVTGMTLLTRGSVEREIEREFENAANELQAIVRYRLSEHARILWSGSAFFDASEQVSRYEWRHFVERQKLNEVLPGIQGVGFAQLIPKDQLASHEQMIRAEGFSDYHVRPTGERDLYSSIVYLEPFTGRNLRAFGYDMFSEPIRREAMARARDNDEAALSGKVILVQETDTDVQAGTLMYVPVYRHGAERETVEQRRAALVGWVYSPYRMGDLIRGIQDLMEKAKRYQVNFSIYDGEEIATGSLLFSSVQADQAEKEHIKSLTTHRFVDFAGRRWTIVLTKHPHDLPTDYRTFIVLSVGTLVTLLLLALSHSLLAIRYRDGQMAEQRATSRYVRSLIESSLDPMVAIAAGGRITDTNAAMERMTGISRDELIGTDFKSCFCEPERAQEGYQQVFSRGHVTNYPLSVRHRNGVTCEVLLNATLYLDDHGQVAGIFAVARDITETKRAEEALKESERKFRTIIDVSPVPKMLVDEHQRLNFLNQAFVSQYGYAMSDIPTMESFWQHVCPGPEYRRWAQEKWQHHLTSAEHDGKPFEPIELMIRCRDETIRTVMGSASPLGASYVGSHLIILYDITEQKRGRQMEKSLREKEALLKEIHHRVKNNLAVVSSLLSLQAKNRDPAVRALLEESRQRVKSMALVHEKLYQTKNVSAVNFDEYVRTIVGEIISLFQIDPSAIKTEIMVENIQLDLETAIPCGLIINELLTNAFKYAFPKNRTGTIRVHFTRDGEVYTLKVSDDGVGMPSDFNPESTQTLGLELVHVLAGQLGGDLKLHSHEGVQAILTFRKRRR